LRGHDVIPLRTYLDIAGLQDVNPNSQLGQEIGSTLSALDKLCAK
jgi:hypothetical protein